MQDLSGAPAGADLSVDLGSSSSAPSSSSSSSASSPAPSMTDHQTRRAEVVSTHVLVPEPEAEKLRELSRRTRVAQSEYLREAVDDLLGKYGRAPIRSDEQ
jgi:hypothetical protein